MSMLEREALARQNILQKLVQDQAAEIEELQRLVEQAAIRVEELESALAEERGGRDAV